MRPTLKQACIAVWMVAGAACGDNGTTTADTHEPGPDGVSDTAITDDVAATDTGNSDDGATTDTANTNDVAATDTGNTNDATITDTTSDDAALTDTADDASTADTTVEDVSSNDIAADTTATPVGAEREGWIVIGAAPTLVRDSGAVTGGMELVRQSGADTRGGGVCLVADLHDATPCTTRDDCVAALPAISDTYFPGGYYYCAAAEGDAAPRCWTRPGGPVAYCVRGPAHRPGVLTTPAVAGLVNGATTEWASYGCMANEALPTGCGSASPADYVVDLGTTLVVTP